MLATSCLCIKEVRVCGISMDVGVCGGRPFFLGYDIRHQLQDRCMCDSAVMQVGNAFWKCPEK